MKTSTDLLVLEYTYTISQIERLQTLAKELKNDLIHRIKEGNAETPFIVVRGKPTRNPSERTKTLETLRENQINTIKENKAEELYNLEREIFQKTQKLQELLTSEYIRELDENLEDSYEITENYSLRHKKNS